VQPAQAAVVPGQLRTFDSRQVIVVTSSSWTISYAKLQTWERRSDGAWIKPFGEMSARIGRNGFILGTSRKQNSGTTPAGNYRIRKTFGQSSNPGTKMPYRNADSDDYWVYDPRDPKTYNILQPYQSPYAYWRTAEAERLAAYSTQYKYAAIISYNLPAKRALGPGGKGAPHDNSGRCDQGRRDLPPRQRIWGYGRVCVLGRVFDAEGVEVVGPCHAASHDHGTKQHRDRAVDTSSRWRSHVLGEGQVNPVQAILAARAAS
jgi:L,D-peptidoglycan transpeptidase YkuD (ErfK/YbiS/YcfS/YnhG family)